MLVVFIAVFNFIIDPYSLTPYNYLSIPNKFSRDDRREKVAKLYTEPTYDTMFFGSSHVYGMNPLTAGKYLGGSSYNAGVGTARIEDHLGFLLFLKRINKVPKNIILGLDFYTFNQNVETNRYFLVNEELNFLQKQAGSDFFFSKFLSFDAFRASIKTLSNYLKNSSNKPRFDEHGTSGHASQNDTFYPPNIQHTEFSEEVVIESYKFAKTVSYRHVSEDRLQYVKDIDALCEELGRRCIFFITPLNGQLLDKINSEEEIRVSFHKFKRELAFITDYYDFARHSEINDNRFFFGNDTMHGTQFTGNLVQARLFADQSVELPANFGVFVPKIK